MLIQRLWTTVAMMSLSFSVANAQTWVMSPQSQMGFQMNSLSIPIVEGDFKNFQAQFNYDARAISKASAEFTIQVNSLKITRPTLQELILGEGLFDVNEFKTIHFKSDQFKKVDDHRYQIVGRLTLHGVTRNVVFDAYLIPHPTLKNSLDVRAIAMINRHDYGMNKSLIGAGKKVYLSIRGQAAIR